MPLAGHDELVIDVQGIFGPLLSLAVAAALVGFLAFALLKVARLIRRREEDEAVEEDKVLVCDECGYDLRATPHRCPECGAIVLNRKAYLFSLGNDWPANPFDLRQPQADEEPMMLRSTPDPIEADLLLQQLTARGICCFLGDHALITHDAIRGRHVPDYFRIFVYSGDIEAARDYLRYAQGVPISMANEVKVS